MVYCKNELTSRQIHECCILSPDLECLCIEVFCQGKRILFASWYRPPASNKDNFKLNISSVLDKMTKMNPNFMVIGADLNFGSNFQFHGTLTTSGVFSSSQGSKSKSQGISSSLRFFLL